MKYGRVYNFSAGPSMLPEAVLEEVQIELLNYQGSGMSATSSWVLNTKYTSLGELSIVRRTSTRTATPTRSSIALLVNRSP